MITIQGKWFDGQTSLQVDATLKVFDNGAWQVVRADSGELLQKHSKFTPEVSAHLGETPRYLTFPEGTSFETRDNDGVNAVLAMVGKSHWSLWVHLLESKLRYVLPAVAIFILLAVVAVQYGVPAASKIIAARMPAAAYHVAGEQTLRLLDKIVFKPSELDADVEKRLRTHLKGTIDAYPDWDIVVRFRKGGPIGPNAFALPDGQIVFTDEMVAIAQHDDELLSVLAHEIGHVVHRHGMRRMVQDSLLSFAILSVTGDASGVSELFLGLPVVLTELAYSRDFERDADRFALDYLHAHQIPWHHFASILTRISEIESEKGQEEGKWSNYLSTHPSTPERVAAFANQNRKPLEN